MPNVKVTNFYVSLTQYTKKNTILEIFLANHVSGSTLKSTVQMQVLIIVN